MQAKFSKHEEGFDPLATSKKDQHYSRLLDLCLKLDSKHDQTDFHACGADFSMASEYVDDEIKKFAAKVQNMPLTAIILLWAKHIKTTPQGIPNIDMMYELLEHNVFGFKSKKREFLTVGEFARIDQSEIIDSIRSNKGWDIWEREGYVHLFVHFEHWLSETTFGFVPKVIDHDREVTKNRKLSYNQYIKIINDLQERERILAKIFYLGGSRSLEEVLSLRIEDIDHFKKTLIISEETISYPRHVLNELLDYIGDRKKGFVFTGKDGERINHTVPYRALKTIIPKRCLDPSFTFKDFVKNI